MKLIIATFEVREDEAEKLTKLLEFVAGESGAICITAESPEFDGQTTTEVWVYPKQVSK